MSARRFSNLRLNDIDTLDDLTRVKSVVVRSVKKDGWAILNADDEYCMKIVNDLSCNIAYFSMDEDSPLVKKLSKEGKIVAKNLRGEDLYNKLAEVLK